MKRILVAFLLIVGTPGWVAALGLGSIELNSGLNQPFDARIELISPTTEEIQSLNVGLADTEAFRRAGLDRPFILSRLDFEVVVNDTGSDFIHLTSQEPIREPFLNFLLEASWSSGRLFREYTVLLDPPLYDPNARRVAPSRDRPTPAVQGQPDRPAPASTARPEPEPEPEPEPAPAPTAPRPAPTPATDTPASQPMPRASATGEYGPTVRGDTLWSIASRLRPDTSVTVQQMMLGLLQANPDAFVGNNVNGLLRGHVLRMPDSDGLDRYSAREAMARVSSQNDLWQQARAALAADAAQRPGGAPGSSGTGGTAAVTEDESELQVVTPAGGSGAGQADSGSGDAGGQLAMANEQLESLSAENQDLEERLTEAETIIEDLKRLIALKDDELARLQTQLASAEEEATEPEPQPEAAAEEPALEPEPEPQPEPGPEETQVSSQPESGPAPQGLVGFLMSMVMDNLMVLAAALGLLVLAIAGLVMIRRRAAGRDTDEEVTLAGGVDSGEEATVAPGSEDETEFYADEDSAPNPGIGESTAEEIEIGEIDGDSEDVSEPRRVSARAEPEGAEEDDPLAEVNVFLAYEHFDQAEEFVRDAIKDDPDNLEFHSKLLEVFYASGDKAKYEEAAQDLYDKVDGKGPHWDMAQAMWQEMSPNRSLFDDPTGEEEDSAPQTGGGIVDLTADESGGGDDVALDFDLGVDEATLSATKGNLLDDVEQDEQEDDDGMLDITSGIEWGDTDKIDAAGGDDDDDILDVTAAVGLDSGNDLDYEDTLDIGGDKDSDEQKWNAAGAGGDDNLLDVSSDSNLEGNEIEDDLLDVTAATGAGADSDELLELGTGSGDDKDESGSGGDDDGALDFDFESPDGGDEGKQVDEGGRQADDDDAGLEFDISNYATDDAGSDDDNLSLDSGTDDDESSSDSEAGRDNVISFDSGSGSDGGQGGGIDFGLDMDSGDDDKDAFPDSADEDGSSGKGFSLDSDTDSSDAGEDFSLELDIESDDDQDDSQDIDMERTEEIPQYSADDGDDDDEDSTVFVPRTSETQEQSVEDEMATKLDLAKAYVELGDADSAKSILEEIIADGTDDQRRQAREMMEQVS